MPWRVAECEPVNFLRELARRLHRVIGVAASSLHSVKPSAKHLQRRCCSLVVNQLPGEQDGGVYDLDLLSLMAQPCGEM